MYTDESARMAARAWARISAREESSALVFEHLAGLLRPLGAPTELGETAQEFANDERRHAAATFALARRCDPRVEAARVPAERGPEFESLLETTILAGCIGETLSALELEHMRARCNDPAISSMLARIAAEESRHAEHSWALLAWLLERFPALCDPAAQLFERHYSTIFLGLDRDLPEFGLLADQTRLELWDAGRRHVVARLAARVVLLPRAPVERPLDLC